MIEQPLAEDLAPLTAAESEEQLFASLRRIIRAVDLYSRYLTLRYNLTGPQLVCLRHLLRHGPMASGELARRISLSPATVTGIVDRLEKRGLVRRERSPDDKRRLCITLTETGLATARRMPPPLAETFSHRLNALPPAEREEIERVIAKVADMMESHDLPPDPLLNEHNASLAGVALSPLLTEDGPAGQNGEPTP